MKNRRTIVFALFSGEEVRPGRIVVVRRPLAVPMPRVVAMINLDMVGTLRDNQLIAFGTDSAPQWKEVVDDATAFAKLNVTSSGDGYGPSDQTSFYAKQIPVLHFFTGAHERYHTPEDVADSRQLRGHGARRRFRDERDDAPRRADA